ncbi:protein Jade-1 isoform X4 [Scyliorhinus canicula]|uniref:protein Jade-1 isoform X4 n=1 Tax=Scyliorhinus canicula TaxID=7830 RepID=UPI0018F3ED1E|nr:protein Jade-1 isoform X4 [Scyliorhinus canicula]
MADRSAEQQQWYSPTPLHTLGTSRTLLQTTSTAIHWDCLHSEFASFTLRGQVQSTGPTADGHDLPTESSCSCTATLRRFKCTPTCQWIIRTAFEPEIEKTMKRGRLPSSSDDSDDNDSHSTSWSQHSRSRHRRSSTSRHEDRKPSEVYRTDLITAMKLHDSHQLNTEEYYILADSWRQEWEKGVQVPVSPESVPQATVRITDEMDKAVIFARPRKYIHSSGSEPPELGYVDIRTLAESVCRYDLDDMDVEWLNLLNEEFKGMGMTELDEFTMEKVMEDLERRCYDNMNHAIETEEGLGIEYDEDVVCDVCQSPDGEDDNEMVFCDKCNICVHQACYGILKVPEGSWLCRTCALGVQPKCLLCPKKAGAMKPTRSGTKWVHVSCALWIPEVSIGCPEKMEPITKVSHVPASRWALVCSLCSEKTGACIQVRNLTYMVTRREKIKRSICRVQEQIFHHQMNLLEEERISGAPSAFQSEDTLFLGWLAQSHLASKTGGLQWKSNRELETGQRSDHYTDAVWHERSSHLSGRTQSRPDSASRSLLKQSNRSSDCKTIASLHGVREDCTIKSILPPCSKVRAVSSTNSRERNNGLTAPDHRRKTDSNGRSTGSKAELRERVCSKRDKSNVPAELTLRQSENKQALCAPICKMASVSIRRLSGDGSHSHSKCNGTLGKTACNQMAVPTGRSAVKVPTTPTSPIKNWGGFRIPKKGERKQHEERSQPCRQNSESTKYQHLGSQRVSSKERAKVRLSPDNENDGYSPDAEMSDSETESTDNCKPQRLNSNSAMVSRRYGTDIIRRSILAS